MALLWTKLQAPIPHAKHLARPQLLQKLDAGVEKRVTLVVAPAGYGKSALLSDWHGRLNKTAQAGKGPAAAWLSLEESDNDPLRFLAYLLAAIQSAVPQIGQTTQAILETQRQTQAEPLLVPLINDLAHSQPLHLILDDYHTLHQPQIHNYLAFLLDHAPATLHLSISARVGPPIPLARLRAQHLLFEIGPTDLRLTPQENRRFWQQAAGLPLSTKDADLLHQRTEGWITGVQLAALFLQRSAGEESQTADLAYLVRAFDGSHEFLVDYLAGEVLQEQPPEIGRFLRQTAVLDRFCAPLCDALSGKNGRKTPESQSILDHLRQQNLFLEPLDYERRWFRYHPLFAEFLLTQLHRCEEAAEIAALHRRASQWFAANGYPDEAVHHALQAGDEQQAACLIESYCREVWLAGDFHRLRRWLSQLPDTAIAANPRLCLYHAWSLTADGDYGAAAARLEQAAQNRPQKDPDPELNAMQATIPLLLRFQHAPDPACSLPALRRSLAALPDEAAPWRLIGLIGLGVASAEFGETAAAEQTFYNALNLSEQIRSDYLTFLAYHNLLEFQLKQARLHQAQETCTRLLRHAQNSRLRLLLEANAHFSLGEILLEWNHRPEAEHHLCEALTKGQQIGLLTTQANALTRLAWLAQLQGAAHKAEEYFRQVELLVQHRADDPFSHRLQAAHRAALKLAFSNWEPLAHWIHRIEAAAPWHQQPISEIGRIETLTLAHSYIARAFDNHKPELARKALRLLVLLQQQAQANNEGRLRLELMAVSACAQFILDDESAYETLERLLTSAEPKGFCRMFLVLGRPMEALLRQAAAKTISSDYIADYIDTLLLAFAMDSAPKEPILSERELDVLRLVAAGQTNQAIAAALCVSINTVKTHLKRINARLETSNRLTAVSRARELSLF